MQSRKYKVLVDEALCKSCEICVRFCPKSVLQMSDNGKAFPANQQECIGCKICEIRCPDFAITVEVDEVD